MGKMLIILVLAHGIFGWGELTQDDPQDPMKDYYYGVKQFLEAEYGMRPDLELVLIAPTLPAAESIEARGAALKERIEAEMKNWPSGARVHILAHSMGGLDARWVIVQEGMADRIASLTTIATPHRGTTLGDLAYDELPIILPTLKGVGLIDKTTRSIWRNLPFTRKANLNQIEFLQHMLGNFHGSERNEIKAGLYALTLNGAAEFNDRMASKEDAIRARTENPVAYFAYGGSMQPNQTPLLKPGEKMIDKFGKREERKCLDVEEGSCNDGAVSVWSAHYPWDDAGQHYVKTIPFDHFMQINWRVPDKRPAGEMPDELKVFYREAMENILRVQREQPSESVVR